MASWKVKRAPAFLAAVLAGLVLYLSACNGDKPTGPPQPKDYVVYFDDSGNPGWIYAYHVGSDLLDSFQVAVGSLRGLTVSADGKKLYLALQDSCFMLEIGNPQNLTKLPYDAGGGIAVSPDNRLVAIQGNDLYVLSTSDYSVVFHDTDQTYWGTFSYDSRTFYGSRYRDYVYRVEVKGSKPPVRRQFTDFVFTWVRPSPNEHYWYIYAGWGLCHMAVQLFDVGADSVVFSYHFEPGNGQLELTPDGQRLFFTYPDMTISYCWPPSTSLSVLNTGSRAVEHVNIIVDSLYGTQPSLLYLSHIEITPDGRFLVGIDRDIAMLVLVDVETLQVIRHRRIGDPKEPSGFTCQKAL
ncbi:MAG: hypothetical protein ABII79_03190 [bacterium]